MRRMLKSLHSRNRFHVQLEKQELCAYIISIPLEWLESLLSFTNTGTVVNENYSNLARGVDSL